MSPPAARLAETLGVDIRKVTGTGRNGRVMREDVEALRGRVPQPRTAANPVTRVRMSRGARRHRAATARVEADDPALSPARATSTADALMRAPAASPQEPPGSARYA